MAEGVRYCCENCGQTVESWSDGNPYYLDDSGRKQHAYHPRHDLLARCIGNDSPSLCLACGADFLSDSRSPTIVCPRCASAAIVPTSRLAGELCPYCRAGRFARDPHFRAIS